jgi:hypothetical protein
VSQANVIPYDFLVGNGTAGPYVYQFRILAASELEVYVDGQLTTPASVTGVGSASGGTFTMGTLIGTTSLLFFRRVTQKTQLVDYINNDPFAAETHESALDKLTRLVQDFQEVLSRIPQLAVSSRASTRHLTFPTPGDTDTRVLIGWDASKTALALYPPGSFTFTGSSGRVSLAGFLSADDDLGVADVGPAMTAACNEAMAVGAMLEVPPARVGYRISTPVNLTNKNGALTIVGAGIDAPAFGQALFAPVGGSLFLGNTETDNPVFDCCGSNNITFQGINLSTMGMPTPSGMGFLFGTSLTSPANEAPGGVNMGLENVSIHMHYSTNSCPVYYVGGAGLSHFLNVWTLGVYGIMLTATNILNVQSPYVSIGPALGVDGVHAMGCNLLGYGNGQVLYLENCHNTRWDQLYVATIFGGPAYSGQPYAIGVADCLDTKMSVECDYWPTMFATAGIVDNLHIQGSTFPNLTPIGATGGICGYFGGTVVKNSSFYIIPAVSGTVANYHYTANGIAASMQAYANCAFSFDSNASPNVFFGNATTAIGVPYFNLRFDGTSDTASISNNINGVAAAANAQRYFVNGVKFGSA